MELKNNERIDDLQYKGLRIIQNIEGFCFGIDAVLLSDFAKKIKDDSKVIDLGTGTGIISILLCGKTKAKEVIGVEIQKDMVDMARRSSKLNELQDRFKVIESNIKDLDGKVDFGTFDAVVANPPYKKKETGIVNENYRKLISRHEIECTLEDIVSNSYNLLKEHGTLYMIHRPERLADIIYSLKTHKLEPKNIKFVYPKLGKIANLVLIKAVKNAGSFLKNEAPLYVYNEDGSYTQEILDIYGRKEV